MFTLMMMMRSILNGSKLNLPPVMIYDSDEHEALVKTDEVFPCRGSCSPERSEDVGCQFEVSSQHLFRYASEWDPRAPGHTKVTPVSSTSSLYSVL